MLQALTQALFDLAAHLEYVEPLREEVEQVIQAEGWTKLSMAKMRKVDSFIKESQRMTVGASELTFHTTCLASDTDRPIVQLNRKLLKDFTFSNGITLPAGTHVAVATNATHMDEVHDVTTDVFSQFDLSLCRISTKMHMNSTVSDTST